MSKTNFKNTAGIPMKERNQQNDWFTNTICNHKLGLDMDKEVVKLTKNNSTIIESHIKNNNNYNSDLYKKMYEYHCMKNGGKFPTKNKEAKEAINDIVRMIDLENNTYLYRYNHVQFDNMINYIVVPTNDFFNKLKKGDIKLVEDLRKSSGVSNNNDGPKSLASKICVYLSELFFNHDNYYVNDTVVRHVLPYYVEYYQIQGLSQNTKGAYENISYKDLWTILERLRNKMKQTYGENLTRRELDHIMWYCYRLGK